MKIFLTGATGMPGQDLLRTLRESGHECLGVSPADLDLLDVDAVRSSIGTFGPDAIIHILPYTDAVRAETQPEVCMTCNGITTLNVARAARSMQARLMLISNSHVFSSTEEPVPANALRCPSSVLGQSCLQAEEAVCSLSSRYFIVRTSWLFGTGGEHYVDRVRALGRTASQLPAACDVKASPTCAADLARLIDDMIVTTRYGIYHAANEGSCTPAELAQAVLRADGGRCRVIPVSADAASPAAERPHGVCLNMDSLDAAGFRRLPIWEDALRRYLAVNL